MSKKVLSLVLALVMVLGSFSFVSAASYTDVTGESAEAVDRLSKLGILEGYPDGTFKPEGQITRAEFAAVAVRAKGLAQVAKAAQGLPTGFGDVPGTFWASGVVGTAARLGIVNGVGNGQFAPQAPVKYEEAITMLVRVLGYEAMAQAKGGYPYGYLIVANEIGLLDAVKGTQGVPATRGIVAQLTDNALEIEMMVQVGFGSEAKWVVSGSKEHGEDEIYLLDEMGFDVVEGRVTAFDSEDLEITVGKEKLEVEEGFDFYAANGVTVKAWVDGDEVIVYTLKDTVKYDAIEVDGDEITLVTEDEEYEFAKDVTVKDGSYDYAKVVFNKEDEVVFVEAYDFDDFLVVEKMDEEVAVSYDDEELDLEDFTVVEAGKTIAIEEVEANDILFYNEDAELAVVYNNSVEGEISRVYNDSFKFEGKTYDIVADYARYLDGTKLDALTAIVVEDIVDEDPEVEVFFDFAGEVVLVVGTLGEATEDTQLAVLVEDVVEYSGRKGAMVAVDVLTEEGKVVSYDLLAKDVTLAKDAKTGTPVELIIEDGEVEDVKALTTTTASAFELDDKYVDGNRLQAGTLFFNTEDEEVVTLADAKFEKVEKDAVMYVKSGKVVAVFDAETDLDEDTTEYTGLVTKVRALRGGEFEFTMEVAGTEKEFTTENDELGLTIADYEDKVVTVTVGDETNEIIAEKAADIVVEKSGVEGVVTKISVANKTFKIGENTYELDTDAVIYDEEFETLSLRELVSYEDSAEFYIEVYFDGTSARFVDYVLVVKGTPAE